MVKHWMGWCRLCAREDPNNTHINVLLKVEEGFPLAETITQCFGLEINNFNNLPNVICSQCYFHIRTTIRLNERISKVSAMFVELQLTASYEEELDPYTVKARHNLECEFKVLTTDGLPCIETNADFKSGDILPEVDEQMIEMESNKNKILDSNPIKIKTEKDEIDDSKEDSSNSQSGEESSNTSILEKTSAEQKTKRVKRRYRRKKEKEADEQKKPFYCSECRKGFLKLHTYQWHMQSAHSISIDPGLKPKFVCDQCGKEYKTSSALKEHLLSHTDERTLKCRYCDKTFKGNPTLKKHEEIHNETKHVCAICGLKLNTPQILRMHMVVHSDQKKYKCDHCGSEFKRAKALKHHLIVHTGLKPYSCDFCDKTFASGSNCRSHKRKSHPIELAEQEATNKNHTLKSKIPKLSELKVAEVKFTWFGVDLCLFIDDFIGRQVKL